MTNCLHKNEYLVSFNCTISRVLDACLVLTFKIKLQTARDAPWAVALGHISPDTRAYLYNSPNGIISVLSISHPPTYLKWKWLESIPTSVPMRSHQKGCSLKKWMVLAGDTCSLNNRRSRGTIMGHAFF